MAYDEGSAQRIRETLASYADVSERKMFGGLAFMLNGHMTLGLNNEDLMVRVGPDKHEEALNQAHARKMDFTGRPMKGYVFVAPEGYAEDADLLAWVNGASEFTLSLAPK